jgi:hypothetical protein
VRFALVPLWYLWCNGIMTTKVIAMTIRPTSEQVAALEYLQR